jgi:dsRNA-specific ribonuclease
MDTNLQYTPKEILEIEKRIGHQFKTYEGLVGLKIALQKGKYESLEYFGDALLGFVISQLQNPNKSPGELTIERSRLIDREACIEYMKFMGIYDLVKSGKNGRGHDSVVADIFEAIIYTIFCDMGGLSTIGDFLHFFVKRFSPIINNMLASGRKDYMSLVNCYCGRVHHGNPRYDVVIREGPSHAPTFVVKITLPDGVSFVGEKESTISLAKISAAKKVCDEYQIKDV